MNTVNISIGTPNSDNDIDNIMYNIKYYAYLFNFLPSSYQYDRNFVLECVRINPEVVKYLPEIFLNDIDIGLTVVKQNGYYISYLSDTLKENEEIIKCASFEIT